MVVVVKEGKKKKEKTYSLINLATDLLTVVGTLLAGVGLRSFGQLRLDLGGAAVEVGWF